jgi:hypothetical protein
MGENSLAWLPAAVPFAFALFQIIIFSTLFFYKQQLQQVHANISWSQTLAKLVECKDFSHVYQSYLDPWGVYALLIWRLLCCGYFIGPVFTYGYVQTGFANAFYFTLWNIDAITFYYILASACSIIGLYQEKVEAGRTWTWSDTLIKVGYANQILFEALGSTAFFVTTVNFVALNPIFTFWNTNEHFVTSMSFLVELFLSKQSVRWEHLIFTATWALSYIVFSWPMVAFGALDEWPYFFLDAQTPWVLAWYLGLYLLDIFFYFVFYFIGRLRDHVLAADRGGAVRAIPVNIPVTSGHLSEDDNMNL